MYNVKCIVLLKKRLEDFFWIIITIRLLLKAYAMNL